LNEANDQNEVVLASLPAGPAERRIALVVGLVLLAIGVVTVPFGAVHHEATTARAAIQFSLTFLADLITWFLLISQFRMVRSRALLVLASGYLFTSVMNIPEILTMYGQFSPSAILGAGLQTGAWVNLAGFTGFPIAVFFYAVMKKEPRAPTVQSSSRTAIAASVAIVIAIIVALTWIAVAEGPHLPVLLAPSQQSYGNLEHVGVLILVFAAIALLLLWFRRRSVLDLWLSVAMCAWLAQGIAKWVHTAGRASLSYYVGTTLFVISSTVLLIVLLRETMTLYGRLAVSLVTVRRLSAEKLQRSEAYLSEAQALSHTGSFGWNTSNGEIHWSEETYNIFEFDRAVKPALDLVFQRIHPGDIDSVQRTIDRASAAGSDLDFEHRLRMPDGLVKHLRVLARASKTPQGDLEYIGAVTDVTAAKQAEMKIRESEAYLAEAQRLSQTGSWAWNPATAELRYWSDECSRMMGFDPAGGIPPFETIDQRFHPDDRPIFFEKLDRATRERAAFETDYRIIHPGGEIRDIHSVGHPVLGPSGDLVEFVGSVIDVTERKQAEDRIRKSEMELRNILDFAPQQVAVLGPDRARIYINQAMLDYLGLTYEQWRIRDSRRSVHPDDWEHLMRETQSKFSSGIPHEAELRLLRKDGEYRWYLFRYSPLRDEQGRLTRWYVAGTDIEDRKQAEQRLHNENIALREEIDRASMFEEIVGTSPALRAVLSRVSKVAPTDSTVLITGETGTGKELIARAVHKRSKRSSQAFVGVNCAAIPRDLIASELFGHEKGAFTGATQRRSGRFELAEGGTIFLDEIGELPAETQVALLRVLQEREFERVGGTGTIRTNVRVIAATNRDLQAAIAAGTFRNDLFYRLNVFPIEVPPLRERQEDIPVLVEYFIDRFARKAGKNICSVDKRSLELLQSYFWPGNIRELQNVIERSVIVCDTENFSVDESWLSRQPPRSEPKSRPELSRTLAVEEKEMIEAALCESGGRVSGPSGAAIKLGIPGSTLDSKIRSLKIDKNRFKSTYPSTDRN
jgi:formate hydrogenlyase transcriptional activator